MTLWQWLATLRHRHRNLAAVVFNTKDEHWPADLYIELKASTGTDWLTDIDSCDVSVTDADLQFVRDAHRQGCSADLMLTIHNPSSLGTVLHSLQSRGFTTWDRYDESIEIVFPHPVPARLIERITPLYRTNKQFKLDREHGHSAE